MPPKRGSSGAGKRQGKGRERGGGRGAGGKSSRAGKTGHGRGGPRSNLKPQSDGQKRRARGKKKPGSKRPSAGQSARDKAKTGGKGGRQRGSGRGGKTPGKNAIGNLPKAENKKAAKSFWQKVKSRMFKFSTSEIVLDENAQRRADAIGLTKAELSKLKWCFEQIDYDESGEIEITEWLVSSFSQLKQRWRIAI